MLVRSVLATSLLVAGRSALAADAANKNRRLNKRKKKGPKGNFRSKDEEVDEEAVAVDAAFDTAHKRLVNGNQPKDVSTLPLKGVFEKGRPRKEQLATTRKLLEAPLVVVACDPAKDMVDDVLGSVCLPDEECVPYEGSSTGGVCLKATRAIDRAGALFAAASTRKGGGKNGKMNGDFCPPLPPGILADELGDDIYVLYGVSEDRDCFPQSVCYEYYPICFEAYDFTQNGVSYVATSKGYGGGVKNDLCFRNVYNIDDFDNGDPDICYQEVCVGSYRYGISTTAGTKEGCTFSVDGEECECKVDPSDDDCRSIDCSNTNAGTYTNGYVCDSIEIFYQLFPKLVNNDCGGASGKKGGSKRDRRLKK